MSLSRDSAAATPSSGVGLRGVSATLFWCLLGQPGGVHLGYMGSTLFWRQRGPMLPCAFSAEGREVPVSGLLGPCGPAAVLWAVGSVVVDAIYGVFGRWSATHVGYEGFVRVIPALADFNTASAVIRISNVLRVMATGLHAFPDLVFGSPLTSPSLSVCSGCNSGKRAVSPDASTALGPARREAAGLRHNRSATVTSTEPSPYAVPVWAIKRYNNKAPKSFSGQVSCGHESNYTTGGLSVFIA